MVKGKVKPKKKKAIMDKDIQEMRQIIHNMMVLMDRMTTSFQTATDKIVAFDTRLRIVEAKQDLAEGEK